MGALESDIGRGKAGTAKCASFVMAVDKRGLVLLGSSAEQC